MDEQRRRIAEDLTGSLRGEIRCDPLALQMYATDASLYRLVPLAVVFPRGKDDVVTLAKYAEKNSIPLIARGGGTGVAGGCLGTGIVVDFSRFMRKIEHLGSDTVRVQPGIVRDQLNEKLKSQGRYFPPDPSSTATTTVGGMLAVDAAGSHSVRVGSVRDHVESVEVVLAGGHSFLAGRESLDILKTTPLTAAAPQEDRTQEFLTKRTIISKLSKLLADNQQLILDRQPPMIRNAAGYFLRNVLQHDAASNGFVNLPKLLVGSEGTLGLFTSVTLQTMPLPAHRAGVLVLFGQLEGALSSVQKISEQQPSACDLMDRRLLSLAREADPRFHSLISAAAEAALIVETTGLSEHEVQDRLRSVINAVRSANMRAVVAFEAHTPEDVDFLWTLPSRVVPLLTKLKGLSRPLPFVEDIAVPPETIPEFLHAAQRVFQKHEVTASLYAHAAAGQLHLRPFLPPPGPGDGPRIEALARDLYQIVFRVGGSISGEHGDGLARTSFLRSQYGPLYRVFQQVKDIFDPHNLLNPGKIVSDDPHMTARNFRPPPQASPTITELQLQWSPQEMTEAAARCNGCGECRTQSPDLRMCPFFRIDPGEESSPRSKANVARGILNGTLSPEVLADDEMQRLSNLCFNCKQCELECPSNVNIPQLMIETKAAYVAANGLSRADWILSRAHSVGALGSMLAFAANWMLTSRPARWVLEKTLGISQHRKLPRFARRSFLRSVGKRYADRPAAVGKTVPVAFFVGEYANYYDPELAHAFVAILKHNGVPFAVPPGQTTSGMAMISAGDLEAARDVAEKNIRVLADFAREGCQIVCTEPAAAVCLRTEYPQLVDHPDAALVASKTIEAGAYLAELHERKRLLTNFTPLEMSVGYHTPCHLKALTGTSSFAKLLTLIPELQLQQLQDGCSGMAGAWGLSQKNFSTSLKLGWDLISQMRQQDFRVGVTECSACKLQMEQGTTTPTLHPLKLLALSYGLMPELRDRLRPTTNKLTAS